jgi:hypothetical protein
MQKKSNNRKNPLIVLLLKNKEIRSLLYSFLEPSERVELLCSSKLLKKAIKAEHKKREKWLNDDSFNGILMRMIFKSAKKPRRNVFKTKIFDINYEKMLEKYDWILLNSTEKENNEIMEDLKGIIPEKLMKGFKKFIFYSPELKKYLAVHRSFVDANMEIFRKINQRKREKLEEEDEDSEKTDFVKLAESEEFQVQNFLGIDNGMMIRQRLLHERMQELEAEKTEKLANMEKTLLKQLFTTRRITMLLLQGGYFSFVALEGEKELVRKSDHKYVIRKKQGGRQIKAIGMSSSSIGGQIRLNNELKHQENVTRMLKECEEFLEKSEFVIVQAPGLNKDILFDEGRALEKWKMDTKFRTLGLDVRRANYSENMRVFGEIIKVYIVAEEDYC